MFIDPNAPVQPNQYNIEFHDLLAMINDRKPASILEIGVCEGGTLYQWMKAVARGGTVCGIDVPGGLWGKPGSDNQVEWRKWARSLGVKLEILLSNSHYPASIKWAIDRSPFDVLFIDGDHSYKGVLQDFKDYSPLVSSGGMVILHDIVVHPNDPLIGVHQLWSELRHSSITCIELLSKSKQTERGLGVCLF